MSAKPETLYCLYRSYVKRRQYFPDILIKLYTYQVCIPALCFYFICAHALELFFRSSSVAWPTCTLAGFATVTSSRRTCSSTPTPVGS